MKIQYIDRKSGQLVNETPPGEGLLQFLYNHPIGKMLGLPLVRRKFLSEWYGRRMDSPSSTRRIASFVDELGIDLSESKKKLEEFTSFNDFFYRELKPGARPIGNGLVSPGDGRLLAFQRAEDVNEFFVKGQRFTLPEFLQSAKLAEAYKNAPMLILRLAPNDYHRYHFPYDGTPSESEHIKGYYYSVSPYALAENFAKVFLGNVREICHFTLPSQKKMLIMPVGATMVGSIVSTYQPNQAIVKGHEMGYFAFGGSTIVLLLPPDTFNVDADLLQNTQRGLETYVRMGESIGVEM